MIRLLASSAAAAALLWTLGASAQMSHNHGADQPSCTDPGLACATKVTPAFAPDGALWLAWAAGGLVSVARSSDLGRSFAPPVALNANPLDLDWGPDARPKIVVGRDGRISVAFARFRDQRFNGEVFYSRSSDGGRTFAKPLPITPNVESQRFEALALDADGSVFAAWLDKRNRVPAAARNEKYPGAALAFAWSSDHGAGVSDTRIAHDNTCECCRLGVAFAGPGRPAIVFRNIFGEMVRDHAVMTFADRQTPGPVYRVSVDDWATEACPHHGPSLAIARDGSYHVAWFTNGRARRGLFYARSTDGGQTFSEPMPIGRPDRAPSHPYLIATDGALWLAWKEFDGEETSVPSMVSHDNGRTWSAPKVAAKTTDSSDLPLLATDGRNAFLSWQTKADGYRLMPLEATQ